jgi:hypothetical protein
MAFDWNDYLAVASQLAPKLDEASRRTAISRAYYCVFNLANARAISRVGPTRRCAFSPVVLGTIQEDIRPNVRPPLETPETD